MCLGMAAGQLQVSGGGPHCGSLDNMEYKENCSLDLYNSQEFSQYQVTLLTLNQKQKTSKISLCCLKKEKFIWS